MTQNFARAALSAALCSSLLMVSALAAAGPIEDGVKLLEAQRYAEATKLFQKEAAKDNPRAMYYLGDMLNQGLGTHRQPLSATAWWEKGAYLGDVDCQLALASAYRAGLGVKLDPRQALIWDRVAAKHGSPEAMRNIGDYFAQGNGQEVDFKEAAKWYWRGANGGFPGAQRALAQLLMTGDGVDKDPAAAYVLMRAASQAQKNYAPDRNAAADARVLRHELSADQLAKAEKLTKESVLESLKALGAGD